MMLKQAIDKDFDRLTRFYRYVIANTEGMEKYARWEYGLHPTDEMLLQYIRSGAMYFCGENESISSAVAVTDRQGEDYHGAEWSFPLADDEVAVVHILCVHPDMQKCGVAKNIMGAVIELSRQMGKKAVRLDALACNTPAHRLYESLGFSRRGQKRWLTDNVGWADFELFELVL